MKAKAPSWWRFSNSVNLAIIGVIALAVAAGVYVCFDAGAASSSLATHAGGDGLFSGVFGFTAGAFDVLGVLGLALLAWVGFRLVDIYSRTGKDVPKSEWE